jgi:hypothetical protein
MDRINSRIAQAYGYAVCFIAVIVILISIKSVVNAAIDLSDPIRAENGGYGRSGRALSSFEIYKLEARREPNPRGTVPMPVGATQTVRADSLSDADLRKMYDAEREQVIGNVKFRSIRTLVGSLLLIVVAAVLFVIHWRWLRQRDAIPTTP